VTFVARRWGLAVGLLTACPAAGPQEPSGGSSESGGPPVTTSGAPETTDPGVQTVTGATEAETGSDTGTSTGAETETETGETSTAGVDCAPLVAGVADAVSGASCALVLAFDGDVRVTGWAAVCGAAPDPLFTSKSAAGQTSCCTEGVSIGPEGVSPFVVYLEPSDLDGGVAVVSNHVGQVVVEAGIGVAAPGTISAPALASVDELGVGAGCSPGGFSFAALADHDVNNLEAGVPQATIVALQAALDATAVPAGLAAASLERSLVVAYEPQAGDPAKAYLVVLELTGV
jgi:hypothetical protein